LQLSINLVCVSGVSAQNFSNVLSDTYPVYRLLVEYFGSVAGAFCNLRFRENTTDKTTGYFGAGYSSNYLGSASSYQAKNNASEAVLATCESVGFTISSVDIYRTNATNGGITGTSFDNRNAAMVAVGYTNATMSNFNGFSLIPSSGTLTGKAYLYGYTE
jgi:hypothetical protein